MPEDVPGCHVHLFFRSVTLRSDLSVLNDSLGGSEIRLPVYQWPVLLCVSFSQFLIPLTGLHFGC